MIRRIPLHHLTDIEKLKIISRCAQLLVEKGKRDPKIRMLAVKIVRNCKPKDYLCEAKTLHNWIKNDSNIRYVKDTFGVERFATVKRTLREAAGDCDDKSLTFSALAESIGHETRLVLVDSDMSGKFTHVIPQVKVDNNWLFAETTKPNALLGWKPPMTRAYIIARDKDTFVDSVLNEIEGLIGIGE